MRYVELERVADGRTICGIVKDIGCQQGGGVEVNHECSMSTGTALQTNKLGAYEPGWERLTDYLRLLIVLCPTQLFSGYNPSE